MSSNDDAALVRAIGPVGFTAGTINVIVGAGIFALPAALAHELGSAAPLAFLISAVVMGLVTACMASAGKYVSRSGGTNAYAEVAFGPFAGFLTGVICWLSNVFASAAVAAAVADAVASLAPSVMAHAVARPALIVVVYFAFTLINLRGVSSGSRLATTAAAIKFLALLGFVAIGASLVRPENLTLAHVPSGEALGRGAILAVFALSGMEISLGASGEVRNPRRTIPLGLAVAMILVCLLYVSVQVVAQGALGSALASSSAPLADALNRRGLAGGVLITIAGLISMGGWIAGDLLGSSRILFAFGREGMLPRALGAVHPIYRVPHVAILFHASVACAMALSGTFALFAVLGSITVIVVYLSCAAAAWKLQVTDASRDAAKSRLPIWLVPVCAIAGLLWMLSYSSGVELLAIGAVVIVASVFYRLTAASRRAAAAV